MRERGKYLPTAHDVHLPHSLSFGPPWERNTSACDSWRSLHVPLSSIHHERELHLPMTHDVLYLSPCPPIHHESTSMIADVLYLSPCSLVCHEIKKYICLWLMTSSTSPFVVQSAMRKRHTSAYDSWCSLLVPLSSNLPWGRELHLPMTHDVLYLFFCCPIRHEREIHLRLMMFFTCPIVLQSTLKEIHLPKTHDIFYLSLCSPVRH